MTINIYDPRTMLTAVRSLMPVRTFLKDMFFSKIQTFTTENVDVDYYKGRRKMAPFVSPRLAGKVINRDGFTTKTYKPPMIKPIRMITGDDIMKRSMGENVYTVKSPEDRALEMLAQDMIELDEMITRREEWMVSQILFTGKVHMIGDGVDETLEFDFTNKETLLDPEKWTAETSDPIADLKRWRLQIIKNSGLTPDVVIMASDVVDIFTNNLTVQKLMDIRRIELGEIKPRTLPNGVTFIGTITSLGLDIYSYDEWYFDEETQTEKPMVPEGQLLMGSTRAHSSMLYGAVTITDSVTNNFMTYEGARIPDSWSQKNPSARYLQMNSRPLPIPHEVESWIVANVK